MFPLPYLAGYNYYPNEAQVILENAIVQVVRHANLLSFVPPSLCEVSYDEKTKLYTFELVLYNNVSHYSRDCAERDVNRLNHHFQHLQTNCAKTRDNLYNTHCTKLQQYQYEMQTYGHSSIIPEQSWIQYLEYCKTWQYFLSATILFVSCTKASYDRHGRICVVCFKINC